MGKDFKKGVHKKREKGKNILRKRISIMKF